MTRFVDCRVLSLMAGLVLAVCACGLEAPSAQAGEACSNEQQRAEQPYGLGLPDCRAYEMVSPLEKNGNDAVAQEALALKARSSVSGEAVTYDSIGSFAGPAGSNFLNQYLSRRGTGGWSTQDLTPTAASPKGNLLSETAFQDLLFTPEMTAGVASVPTSTGMPTLAPGAPEGYGNLYVANFAAGSYQAITNRIPPGIEPNNFEELFGIYGASDPFVAGASSDLSRVVFVDHSNLTPEAPPNTSETAFNLYDWVDGNLSLVNVGPDGKPMVGGAQPGAGFPGSSFLSTGADQWHSVSNDGLRVFFTSPLLDEVEQGLFESYSGKEQEIFEEEGVDILKPQVYVRVNPEQPQGPVDGEDKCLVPADACTVEVSASQKTNGSGAGGSDPHGPHAAFFWMASTDGERVFFTSNTELTDDANTGSEDNAANLYEYDTQDGKLTDLTVDTTPSDKNGAEVQGVVTESEDGSYVYFVAKGVLAANAVAGQPNLYLTHGGTITLVTTLSANDATDWGGYNGYPAQSGAPGTVNREIGPAVNYNVRVTPDGKHLAFLSFKGLTGYNNQPAEPQDCFGGPCKEVFSYDAVSGSLVCVSCDPSGARPVGYALLSGGAGWAEQTSLFYIPRNFSDDGSRLFFESEDPLVPHDSNGREDVYEYREGQLYPVSDVAGNAASLFLDASPSGNDVFFATEDQLLGQDTDFRVDVYDARVGGGFPVVSVPPVCANGDSCKGPVAPQPGVFGAPASSTFVGAGNVAPVVVKSTVKAKRKPKPKRKRRPRKRRKARGHGGRVSRQGRGR